MLGLCAPPILDSPEVGQPAPDFKLVDVRGAKWRLQDFAGRWLVVYFYPKDDTPGCTREACGFRDASEEFSKQGVQVIGISVDGASRHRRFIAGHGLPFLLLSDPGAKVAGRYGAHGRLLGWRYAKRWTFLIDPEGIIRHIWRKVDTHRHARQVLDVLAGFMGERG